MFSQSGQSTELLIDGRPIPAIAITTARRSFDDRSWANDPALRVRCLRQLHESIAKHTEQFRETLVAAP